MADENTEVTNEGTPNTEVAQVQSAQPEYTEAEQRAMEQGWVPQDQFTGHGKWRPAEEFLDRGELFAKIEEQKRRLQSVEGTAQELKKHLEKVRKTEYQRALDTLRADKKAALNEGDADAVVAIDDKIADLREEQKQVESAPVVQSQEPNPVFVIWENRNPWYKTDRAMKVYADNIAQELAAKGMAPVELLNEVERQTKKEFAHKFTNPNRNKPGAVEAGGSKGSVKNDNFELSDAEKRVMDKFVKSGLMTREEYIADIKAERGTRS